MKPPPRIDLGTVKPTLFAWVGTLVVGDVVAWRCAHQHVEADQAIVCARNARLVVAPGAVHADVGQKPREVARLWPRRARR